jgi:pyruvate dehydrogenase E1 component alpha subunit
MSAVQATGAEVHNAASAAGTPEAELAHKCLYYMVLMREVEDRIERKLFRQGKVLGGVYVGRGQEAIAVGSCIDLREDDVVCPSHRDMGAFLIRGMSLRTIFAQYMGKKTGATKGKDSNMHMGSLEHNLIAFISMLGDNVPVAAGIGFRSRCAVRIEC